MGLAIQVDKEHVPDNKQTMDAQMEKERTWAVKEQ